MGDGAGALRTLGLGPGATPDEIRAAYRRLAKANHPDKFAHDPRLQVRATARMKAINAAYRELRPYLDGSRPLDFATPPPPRRPPTPPPRRARTFDASSGAPYRSRPRAASGFEGNLGRWMLLLIWIPLLVARRTACDPPKPPPSTRRDVERAMREAQEAQDVWRRLLEEYPELKKNKPLSKEKLEELIRRITKEPPPAGDR